MKLRTILILIFLSTILSFVYLVELNLSGLVVTAVLIVVGIQILRGVEMGLKKSSVNKHKKVSRKRSTLKTIEEHAESWIHSCKFMSSMKLGNPAEGKIKVKLDYTRDSLKNLDNLKTAELITVNVGSTVYFSLVCYVFLVLKKEFGGKIKPSTIDTAPDGQRNYNEEVAEIHKTVLLLEEGKFNKKIGKYFALVLPVKAVSEWIEKDIPLYHWFENTEHYIKTGKTNKNFELETKDESKHPSLDTLEKLKKEVKKR